MAAGDRPIAYLAKPASGAGRGILVLHDAWGFGDFVCDGCDRLAREGFAARLDAYDAAAAAETWGALLAFFRSELA